MAEATAFYGRFAHTPSRGGLEILDDTLVMIDSKGTITDVLGGSDVCAGRFGVGAWAACGAWTPTKNSAHGSAGSLCHNAQCYT